MFQPSQSTYTIKDLPDMIKAVEVCLALEEFETAMQSEIKQYSKKIKFKGFRPGKVPGEIVMRRYGEEIRENVLSDLLNRYYRLAVKEHRLVPDSETEVKVKKPAGKKNAGVYELSFAIQPDFDIAQIQSLDCQLCRAKLDDQDIAEAIEDMRKKNLVWSKKEKAAEVGDQVSFRFEMTLEDDDRNKEPESSRMQLEIGARHLFADIADQLEGTKSGDRKRVQFVFPDTFDVPEYAGKSAIFEIEVDAVSTKELPVVDDEFANRLTQTDGGKEKLTEMVEQYLRNQAESLAKNLNRKIVRVAMLRDFDLSLSKKSVEHTFQRYLGYWRESKKVPDQKALEPSNTERAGLEKQVRDDMKLKVIFTKLMEHHRFKPDLRRVEAMALSDAQMSQNPKKTYQNIMKSEEERQRYQNYVVEDMIFEHIIKVANGRYRELSLRGLREFESSLADDATPDAAS